MIKTQIKEFGILFIVLFVYVLSVGKDPILGDSLGFTIQAYKGFDLGTNSTNHFLYTNTLTIIHRIFPWFNPHFLFVGFSIFCSGFTLYFFRKLLKLFGIAGYSADAMVLLLAFSFTFWRVSIITEVYSFYLLFVMVFFCHAFRALFKGNSRNFLWASFFFGILFLIHIQTILLGFFYVYFLFRWFLVHRKSFFQGILIPLILVLILLIPVLQGKQSFIAIFSDSSYQQQFFHFETFSFLKGIGRNIVFMGYNFLFFLPFIFIGFKKIPSKRAILLCLVPYLFFILKHEVSDSYVFHLVPYIFLFVMVGKGLEKNKDFKKIILVSLLPLIYFSTYKLIIPTSYGKKINQEIGFKGGVRYLFFPPLRENPDISVFITTYEENKLQDHNTYEGQYKWAKEWVQIKENF